MFARVSVYEVPEDRRGEAERSFKEALGRISESRGLEHAYALFGCEGRHAITITLWEDQGAMAESRVAASRLRSEAAGSVDADVVSVEEFVVVAGAA